MERFAVQFVVKKAQNIFACIRSGHHIMQGLVIHGKNGLLGCLIGQELGRVRQQFVREIRDHLVGLPSRGVRGEIFGLVETVVAENQHQSSKAFDDQRFAAHGGENFQSQFVRVQIVTERLQQKVGRFSKFPIPVGDGRPPGNGGWRPVDKPFWKQASRRRPEQDDPSLIGGDVR